MATQPKIIRHKNPSGKVTWHRAGFVDEQGRQRYSPRYHGKCSLTRKRAQNWLYANTHIWVEVMNVEQRIVDADGKSKTIQLGTEKII